ncbi:unnamed protein product, partial [marine sediment metagenome]
MKKLIRLIKKFDVSLKIHYGKNGFGQWGWYIRVDYKEVYSETLRSAVRKM